jgi:type II secretory pathway component PulF
MSIEQVILIAGAAATFALVAISVFLILLGRRAGRFGALAAIMALAYPILAYLVLTGFLNVLAPDPITGATHTPREILVAACGRLIPVLLVVMLPCVWLLYVHRRYREARQGELAQVIATAVEAQMPLAPAVLAYLHDRPREGRAAWDAALMAVCPPGYLVWTQRRTFDDRVARLSALLAIGMPLPAALRTVPSVAPPELAVAADVGDATGRLADCLRRCDRERLRVVMLEVLPRLLYPMMLLAFITVVAVFLAKDVAPKFQRILADSQQSLPAATDRLFSIAGDIDVYWDAIGLAVLGLAGLVLLLKVSPMLQWHLPVVGRLIRWETQGLVLGMLGELFKSDRPAHEALGLLASAPDLPRAARRRLEKAQQGVAAGEPLPDALRGAGLLPRAMSPLVSAAIRTHTLPSALTELGELLTTRAVRLVRRVSLIISPVLVIAVGAMVAFIVVSIFMPLIQLLTRLSEF